MSYQDSDTPLHLAAWQGQSQIITRLIEAGAEIEARDSVSPVAVLHLGKLEPSLSYFRLHKTWAIVSSHYSSFTCTELEGSG